MKPQTEIMVNRYSRMNAKASSNRIAIYSHIIETLLEYKDPKYQHDVLKAFVQSEIIEYDNNVHIDRMNYDIGYCRDVIAAYLTATEGSFSKIELYCEVGLYEQFDSSKISGYQNQNFKEVWNELIVQDAIFFKDFRYFKKLSSF